MYMYFNLDTATTVHIGFPSKKKFFLQTLKSTQIKVQGFCIQIKYVYIPEKFKKLTTRQLCNYYFLLFAGKKMIITKFFTRESSLY